MHSVSLAQTLGNQDFHRLPDELVALVAEELLGHPVRQHDAPLGVHHHEAVRRRVDDQAEAPLGELAGLELALQTRRVLAEPGLDALVSQAELREAPDDDDREAAVGELGARHSGARGQHRAEQDADRRDRRRDPRRAPAANADRRSDEQRERDLDDALERQQRVDQDQEGRDREHRRQEGGQEDLAGSRVLTS